MKTTTIPTTQVVIINDILGTRRQYVAPQTVAETLTNNSEIARARDYCGELEWRESWKAAPPALGCAVQHDEERILVRWFADGDPQAALDNLSDVLAGRKPEGGVA